MAVSKKQMNAFAGVTTDGANESKYRHTSGRDETAEQAQAAEPESTPTPARNVGGRPRNEIQRRKTVLYLNPSNVTEMKTRAVSADARFSDVVDALISYHMGDLTDGEILAVKNANRPKNTLT